MTPKTPSQRVEALRKRRDELGLKRRELYAHDDDWPAIQALTARLQRKRSSSGRESKRRSL